MKPHPHDPPEDEDDGWDSQWKDAAWLRSTNADTPSSSRHVRTRQEALENNVITVVNQTRANHGLNGLVTDERLRTAARAHSHDMATRRYLAHLSPEGITPHARMLAAGCAHPAAENVALHEPNALLVVRAWMNSPGHRVNILHPLFRTIGVGVFLQTSPRVAWWTQNFGYA
ncbi:CAP domain-containing protein [Streptomyces zaomyceticus]|uniref:CAP domain-containing protein n=1 Tax=Streptomyces zaomyceticus TaxID=68286 RepID=UPI0036783771